MNIELKPRISPGTTLLPDVSLKHVWITAGGFNCEVAQVTSDRTLSDADLRTCWNQRLRGRPVPLLLFQEAGDTVAICGPDGTTPMVVRLHLGTAQIVLRSVLALPSTEFVSGYLALLRRTRGSAGVPGLRNQQLLGTHFLCRVLPRLRQAEWLEWKAKARGLRALSGRALFQRLGYEVILSSTPREFVLSIGGQPVAILHSYDPHVNLDRMVRIPGLPGDGVQPAAAVIRAAQRENVHYAFLTSGSIVRLQAVQPPEGVEETASTAAYLELDLDLLPEEFLAILWACCSAPALVPGGHLEQLFADGQRHAVGLRDRFQERVYGEVVPSLVRGLWQAGRGVKIAEDLLYRSTLVLLFRLLFVLYAEDRNLLPVKNPRYTPYSLTHHVEQLVSMGHEGVHFDQRSTAMWDDLRRIFAAIRDGNREWGIPAYNGGLFKDHGSPEAELLASLKLPDDVVGPAIRALAVDQDGDEEGKVDFGDLGVRHIGTVYEGLLSYRVITADVDLAVTKDGAEEIYEPARRGQIVAVRAGEPYMVSPEGGRKTSGSYYTPQFAVNRLVEGALDPVLARHFAGLDGMDQDASAESFFDVKVCDPSMGSGHFLSRALDYIADKLQGYLARRPLTKVSAEMERARRQVTSVGEQFGIPDLADGTSDFDLLRRLVLKRCIYGVDMNQMAVELAKLSLWLRSFVPGLPLSYLDHNLRWGDSLVGVAGPEIRKELDGKSFSGRYLSDALAVAFDEAKALGSVDDLELHEVGQSRVIQERIEAHTAPLRELYDAFITHRFIPQFDWDLYLLVAAARQTGDEFAAAHAAEVAVANHPWTAFHWPLAFPEVFLRSQQGFDAVLGNPPWEEVTVEETGFFVRYIPGLKGIGSATVRSKKIAELVRRHPSIQAEYEDEMSRTAQMRAYLKNSFELTRSGDPDLYRAFAERFLQILGNGGSLGVVIPRTAFSGDGTAPFREQLFGIDRYIQLDFLRNTGGWVFADAEPRYTLTLVLMARADSGTLARVSVAGPIDSKERFEWVDKERVDWSVDELRKMSEGLEVPLIPDLQAAALFKRLNEEHPRFDSRDFGFHPVPWAELHATKDRKSGLIKEDGDGWRVYTGDSFDLWNPDYQPITQIVDPKKGLAELRSKRQRSVVWRHNYAPAVMADPTTLPQHSARVLFRDVARNNDSRTVRACLVPPHVFATNKAPSLLFPQGDGMDQVYVLGLLCSIPFDWIARRRVETNLNFFILNGLPMARLSRTDPIRKRIVEVAGRLSCPDDRFADMARQVGVECGPIETAEKQSLIAELDALAALAYGLSEAELTMMFEDFPRTEAGVSGERRAAILNHFRRLGGMMP